MPSSSNVQGAVTILGGTGDIGKSHMMFAIQYTDHIALHCLSATRSAHQPHLPHRIQEAVPRRPDHDSRPQLRQSSGTREAWRRAASDERVLRRCALRRRCRHQHLQHRSHSGSGGAVERCHRPCEPQSLLPERPRSVSGPPSVRLWQLRLLDSPNTMLQVTTALTSLMATSTPSGKGSASSPQTPRPRWRERRQR